MYLLSSSFVSLPFLSFKRPYLGCLSEVDVKTPLHVLISGLGDDTTGWAEDAKLRPCLEYVRNSKYITVPPEYREALTI